jgi:hypothetical protein
LGEKLKYIRLFEGIDSKEIPKSMATALDGIHKISDATIQIHGNLAGANRTSAQGEADLTKTRMEKLSRKAEENRNERNSVIQTLQQLYQQEAEARKGISR